MDVSSLGSWICGLLVPILILGILFIFRMLGAGDIKLLSVIGSMIGPTKILNCISYSFLIGAVISAALMIQAALSASEFFTYYITSVFISKQEKENYYKSGMPLENFHFTVPIFLSALLYAGGVY